MGFPRSKVRSALSLCKFSAYRDVLYLSCWTGQGCATSCRFVSVLQPMRLAACPCSMLFQPLLCPPQHLALTRTLEVFRNSFGYDIA